MHLEPPTGQERTAMKGRAAELGKAGRRGRGADRAAAEAADLLARIAEMPGAGPRPRGGHPPDGDRRGPGAGARALVRAAGLRQERQGRVLLPQWPTSWALTELTPTGEAAMTELVRRAVR